MGVAQGDTIDVSSSITLTTANERSTMDRLTRIVTSTADVTITNSSSENISFPLHAVIDILDTDYSNVTMPDALGGDGIDPYGKHYYDLSGDLISGVLAPGQSITFGVKFIRLFTIRFRYNVLTYGNLEAGPVNHPPTSDPGGPYSGIVGQSIVFDGSGSYDPDSDTLTYAWDFGDGNTGSGEQPTHTYLAAGTYTMSLIVSDGQLQSDPASTQAIVDASASIPPVADAGFNRTFTLPSGQTQMDVMLDGSGSSDADGTIAGYDWSGTPDPEDIASPVVSLSEGMYTFTLVVTDDDGAPSDPASVTITIEPAPNTPPTADAGGPYTGIVGQSIMFDGSGSSDPDGDTLTYAWDFGDGTTGSGVLSPLHVYAAADLYIVTLTVNDGNGGTASALTTATVYQPPTVNISAEPVTIMAGESAILTWTSQNAETALIDNGVGSVALSGSTSVSPSATTTYEISVSGPGGTATASVTVTVTTSAPSVSISADPMTIEAGQSSTLTWTSSNTDSAYMNNNIGSVDTSGFTSVSPSETTTYVITVNGPGGTASDSATVTVSTENESPVIDAEIELTGPEMETMICTVTGSDPDGDYPLTFSYNGSVLPSASSFEPKADNVYEFSWQPTYDDAGDYTVRFTVTDSEGLS
ncbi:MAG: PKD domain-containing protein, partial [Deltaproteobacteria bacterium]|nr:PKD domain-containing protein [Deltaproteobacteria bacterium]